MEYGAHLPLIDFNGKGWQARDLDSYADAARETGFSALAANDHFVFQKPWLDCIVALSSVVSRSGNMMLATTVSLPVVRGPVALAKAAAALDIISGGRLVLGVGPGSSARDYQAVGLSFDERWPRLDESIKVMRHHLRGDAPAFQGRFYSTDAALEPRPNRPQGPAIWIGSWGSEAGLRRVARLGDGWLASAYNTTPRQSAEAIEKLAGALQAAGKDPSAFPYSLATMWTYVTEDEAKRHSTLDALAAMLNRPPDALGEQVLIGAPEECAAKLSAYAGAGIGRVFIWPLADELTQLDLFMTKVAPLVAA